MSGSLAGPSNASTPQIAILGARGIPARYGGFETFVDELSRRLVTRGVRVTVYCEAEESTGLTEYEGVQLVHVPARAPGPARTIGYDVACLWRARKEFDVVYMLGYGASFACFLPRLWGRAVWINMDGLEWRRSKWNPLARFWLKTMEGIALRTATRVIYDNTALAEEIESRRHKPKQSSVLEYGAPLLRDPTPTERLAEMGVTPGEYYLVVCRFEPENHVIEIARAYAASGLQRPLLLVANKDIGTSYAADTLQQASERVRFVGTVYDQDLLLPLRQHCRAYIHGHSVGGTNPSLLEAMGCGNYILSHDNPFNRVTLGDAADFFVDESELVQRLQECEAKSDGELHGKRQAVLQRVDSHYTWDLIADRYHELIRSTVDG